jgi:hypothetical protein
MSAPRWLRRLLDYKTDLVLWETCPVSPRWLPAKRSKPRVRINANDWIRHDGGVFPFAPRTPVEVIFLYDEPAAVEYAEQWPESWWTNTASDWRRNIRWYRIVANHAHDPVPPIGGRA